MTEYIDIQLSKMVATFNSNHPLLFKFMKINIDTLNSLANNYIWYSDVKYFNDPFDGDIIGQANSINFFNVSSVVKKENYLISCFTLAYDSILMWSHYAEGHKGMCLVYNCSHRTNNIGPGYEMKISSESYCNKKIVYNDKIVIHPVCYNNTKQRIDVKDETRNGISNRIQNVLQKNPSWEYEMEYRTFAEQKDLVSRNKIFYPNSSLHGVILGSETSMDTLRIIESICNDKECKIYKMEKNYNTFSVNPNQVV